MKLLEVQLAEPARIAASDSSVEIRLQNGPVTGWRDEDSTPNICEAGWKTKFLGHCFWQQWGICAIEYGLFQERESNPIWGYLVRCSSLRNSTSRDITSVFWSNLYLSVPG